MAVESNPKQTGDKSVAVNVRLKSVGQADQPTLVNYSHVGLAQGLAYVDFGFLEPALLGAVAQRAQKGETLPKQLEGTRAVRVALPGDALVRLYQQIQQVLVTTQPNKSKLS